MAAHRYQATTAGTTCLLMLQYPPQDTLNIQSYSSEFWWRQQTKGDVTFGDL